MFGARRRHIKRRGNDIELITGNAEDQVLKASILKGHFTARLLTDQFHQLYVKACRLIGFVEIVIGRVGQINTNLQGLGIGCRQ